MRKIKALVLALPSLAFLCSEVGVGLTASAAFTAPAYAAEKQTVSAKVGKPLKEAQDLAKQKKFKEALAKVKEAQAMPGKTPYEENVINEFTAYVAMNLGDYASAANAYEATLNSGQLSAQQQKQRLDQLVKLYYQAKNYPKVVQTGNRYLKEAGPNVDIALLIAQTYYLQKDYPHAIEAAQALIKMASQTGQPVKEDWLKLLMSSQYALNKDEDRIATLEQLLAKFPSQAYWQDMLNYVQSSASGDRLNLETYRLKAAVGVLKDKEYIDMAQLAMAIGLPGDAKRILDKGFSNKVLGQGASKDREARLLNLANTQVAADQKSLPDQDKEARAAATGEADVKLGETYVTYGDYAKGIEAIKRGLAKGGVKATEEANLHLGVAYLGAKRNAEAIAAFKAVPASSKLSRLAKLWAIYAQNAKG